MAISFKITNEAYRLMLNYNSEAPAPLSGLVAARRDSAAFQMIVQSDLQYSLNVAPGEWFSAKGNRLFGPHERLRVAVEAPFPVTLQLEEFLTDDDGVEKTDILLNQNVRESRGGIPSAVWAQIAVPEDAEAGTYTVTVRLFRSLYSQDETLVAQQSFPLEVSSYVMPASKDWKFYLDLWQHTSNIARKHDVLLWSDEHFEVLKSYARSLADLGQKSITVCVSEIPWNGQSCSRDHAFSGNLFEYSMIPVTKKKDGTFFFDYSKMQQYIDICTEAGICGDIEIFGLVNIWGAEGLSNDILCPDYVENIRIRYLDESDGCMKYVRQGEVLKQYVRSLEAYFMETEQIHRVRIAADEPADVEHYRASLNMLRELAPNFRCKCAINHAEFIEAFHDYIDDFVPYLGCTMLEYERLMGYKEEMQDKKFLWYVCCGGGAPNNYLRTPPIENRMVGIMTSFLKLDGFLRWNYAIWPDDPRHEIRYSFFEAGDTNFVYPAYNGKVLLSLRYKNLQRGIADHELLETLRERKGQEAVDELLKKVMRIHSVSEFFHAGNEWKRNDELFSLDWEDFNALKATLLKLLEA